jgi:hypothetical protein
MTVRGREGVIVTVVLRVPTAAAAVVTVVVKDFRPILALEYGGV